MKLHILSDLHIEYADFDAPQTDADVTILAGDIGVGLRGLDWAESRFSEMPVIYVPGNHEYYDHDVSLIDQLKERAPGNVHVLNDEQLVLADVRFLCSTLWTDFDLFGEADKYFCMQQAGQTMNDFFVIRHDGRRFTPADSVALHEASRGWLKAMLEEPFSGKTVVVTHHLPSSRSVPARYATDLVTAAFASNLDSLMDGDRAVLWVHGHTHDSSDYEICGTRVICNPRGYPNENKGSGFRPDLVVEI